MLPCFSFRVPLASGILRNRLALGECKKELTKSKKDASAAAAANSTK